MSTTPRRRARKVGLAALIAVGALLLSGCDVLGTGFGFLPSDAQDATNQTGQIFDLWNGAWIAALAVGAMVWGLMLWCIIVYRKRKNDNQLPVQLQYHVPLELMYTIIPIIAIGVIFAFTSKSMGEILDTSEEPDVVIEVVGKRWSWDFNYITSDVYFSGVQAELTGEEGVPETLPTLVLPQGERVEFHLRTRDVNHAFWIPSFLTKVDMIAGKTNVIQIIPEQLGTYDGKCAELCGEYHASMLFNVEVVTPEEYEAYMDELADQGNVGRLGPELDNVTNGERSITYEEDDLGGEE